MRITDLEKAFQLGRRLGGWCWERLWGRRGGGGRKGRGGEVGSLLNIFILAVQPEKAMKIKERGRVKGRERERGGCFVCLINRTTP